MAILIEGNKVKVLSGVVEKEVGLSDFLQELSSNIPLTFPILPANCRGLVTSENSSIYIIEQSPRLQTIAYRASPSFNFNVDVYLPWTYFVVDIQNKPMCLQRNTGGFFATKRITSTESEVGWLAIPNLEYHTARHYGVMCRGDITMKDGLLLPEFVDEFICQIWGSFFNNDYFHPESQGISSILGIANHWTQAEYDTYCESRFSGANLARAKTSFVELPNAKYFLAWAKYSKENTLAQFMEELSLHNSSKYSDILSGLGVM